MAHELRPGAGTPGAVENADTGDGQHLTVTQPQSKASYKYAEAAACIGLLAETFPLAFSIYEMRRRPLKVGIHLDILRELDGAVTPIELGRALACYCSNRRYRSRLIAGAQRFDLQGRPAGTPSSRPSLSTPRGMKP
jgi:ProQ/FINO family